MANDSTWRLLAAENTPRILVKYHFNRSGYQIYITDLSRIWGETLSKPDCVQRALDSGCSIDPSQDDDQFRILLGKIQSTFEGERDTSYQLATGIADEDALEVKISAALPKPLADFQWTIMLQLLDQQHLQAQIVAPLMSQASQLQHQIEQLVHELQSKDRVISKICDRLETSGNDLTTVFPGVSNVRISRKSAQREQLAKHVRGLADFDENGWRTQSADFKRDGLTDDAMSRVLSSMPTSTDPASNLEGSGGNEWWKNLDQPPAVSVRNRTMPVSLRSKAVTQDNDEDMQDDMFQRQATPPLLKQHQTLHEEPQIMHASSVDPQEDQTTRSHAQDLDEGGESTTEDEDDLDALPKRSPAPKRRPSHVSPKQPTSKLVAIGGRKRQEPAPVNASIQDMGAVTERSSQPIGFSASRTPTPELHVPAAKPRFKLGTIGGKSKSSTPVTTDSAPSAQGAPPLAKQHKLGAIGGKQSRDSETARTKHEVVVEPEQAESEAPSRARTATKEDTPPPREASQERANKKRDQLKRALEEKAKVPPKKKRKF